MLRTLTFASALALASAHGHMTIPASTRNGGRLATGGDCTTGACFWFTNNMEITGPPTINASMQSLPSVTGGGVEDVYKTSPWRAPGSAKVYGSGCGVAGGGPVRYGNGGQPPPGIKQGMDGLNLPTHGAPTVWKRGSVQPVAWAISANHGGGYTYRMCKNVPGQVSEECFQKGSLEFASEMSALVYPNGTKRAFKATMTNVGTFPKGSWWARDPIPGCNSCNPYTKCGAPLPPSTNCSAPKPPPMAPTFLEKTQGKSCKAVPLAKCGKDVGVNTCLKCGTKSSYDCEQCCPGLKKINKGAYSYCAGGPPGPPKPPCVNRWDDQVNCYGSCDGTLASKTGGSCPSKTGVNAPQFPEPLPGISGFGKIVWPWSVTDTVKVPADIAPGKWLLSWRWDCEESTQIWQNCADITVV